MFDGDPFLVAFIGMFILGGAVFIGLWELGWFIARHLQLGWS